MGLSLQILLESVRGIAGAQASLWMDGNYLELICHSNKDPPLDLDFDRMDRMKTYVEIIRKTARGEVHME